MDHASIPDAPIADASASDVEPDSTAALAPVGDEQDPAPDAEQQLLARIAVADEHSRFGPSFFVTRLRAFVRERCPDPHEALPSVRLHLATGDALDVCHVVGVAPSWVALAVADDDAPGHPMRTELVPYELIVRVTIRSVRPTETRLGFSDRGIPVLAESAADRSAERALTLAAAGRDRDPANDAAQTRCDE